MIKKFLRIGNRQRVYQRFWKPIGRCSSFGAFEGQEVDEFDVRITDDCYNKIKEKMLPKGKMLRLAVKGGEGCDGFTYEFSKESNPSQKDQILEKSGEKLVVIDKESLMLLNGAIIDYEETMAREGYVIQENPNADHTCSCKMSFSPVDSAFGSAF